MNIERPSLCVELEVPRTRSKYRKNGFRLGTRSKKLLGIIHPFMDLTLRLKTEPKLEVSFLIFSGVVS